MTNTSVAILGWIYGRLEALIDKGGKGGSASMRSAQAMMCPVTGFAEIHARAISQRVMTKDVQDELAKLLVEVDLDEFLEQGSPEKVIPLEQQGIWGLAYSKGRLNVPLVFEYDIQKERKKAGMTQTELAQAVGVSQAAVAKWEKGSVPTDAMMEKIKEAIAGYGG